MKTTTTPVGAAANVAARGVPAATEPRPPRVASIDVFRGFVMFLMLAEALHLPQVARSFPDSGAWRWIAFHTSHVEWVGCSLHDLIQPSFSFLVGVALPFSLAARAGRGESGGRMLGHALWRAALLVGLGVFLRSVGRPRTYFTFEDTLSQIGLGYPFLFLLGFVSRRTQVAAFVAIVVGYWGAFALYPTPPAEFDYPAVGVPTDWPHHATGLAAHWNKNSNLAWAFDTWFLNLFPREETFVANRGGYATLSFIPTLATMILGLIAGGWLRDDSSAARRAGWFAMVGAALIVAGYFVGAVGLCPVVKRIWTPSWTLFSGGWCFLILAFCHAVCDAAGRTRWAFPLVVIGANSIFIYVLHGLADQFILQSYRTHLGAEVFRVCGAEFEPLLGGAAVLLTFWLLLWWMYRKRILLRI